MVCVVRERATVNVLSVDVEDYFHAQALSGVIERTDWELLPWRVEANTERLLALFAEAGVHGTFFTLAWVAERHPHLIRRIVAAGHELASHGSEHRRVDEQSPDSFRRDIRRAKRRLEDIGGVKVVGYRAPTFSIGRQTLWAFDILAEEGYRYSSSVYPIRHDLYGMPEAPRGRFRPNLRHPLEEYPISTVRVGGRTLPCGGGGYFRLLPYAISRAAIARVNRVERRPAIFYIHPWEIDPGQPRVKGLALKARLRHTLNLDRTEARLRRLVADFAWDRMDRVFQGGG
ncbi:MAG: DUF3473 domain-containing protein [Magnetospirillum sp.]|nr:DUF3473 domain-containing protein [Magnetospirillum sp.]